MKTKKILTLAFVALMSLGLTSCKCLQSGNNKNETAMVKDFTLEGSEWKLESIQGEKFEKPEQMRNDYISIKFNEGYAGTSDGCNGMSGEFTQDGENLTFGMFRATKMYCDWQTFSVPFHEVKSFRTNGQQLELISENQQVIATYSKL